MVAGLCLGAAGMVAGLGATGMVAGLCTSAGVLAWDRCHEAFAERCYHVVRAYSYIAARIICDRRFYERIDNVQFRASICELARCQF